MKILVLGCGRVGLTIASELVKTFDVAVVDIHKSQTDLFMAIETSHEKKSLVTAIDEWAIPHIIKHMGEVDLIVSAVPGSIGFSIAKAVIEARKNLVDISFFPEDAYELKDLAEELKVFAAFDCGIAPGFSNMILGWYEKIEEVKSYTCYVAGLPFERTLPFEYKAGFSPSDVIEEYVRPARYIENNKIVIKPALSEREELNFEGIGTLEAFNSDGLRTLLRGSKCPNIKEKTMRFPGHAKMMEVFRETGFFDTTPIFIKGEPIRPLDITSKLLFDKWQFKTNEKDFTVMRSIIECEDRTIVMDLKDEWKNGEASMSRTTGFTCTGVVKAFASGLLNNKFFYTPEDIGAQCFKNIENELLEKGVEISWITLNDRKTI